MRFQVVMLILSLYSVCIESVAVGQARSNGRRKRSVISLPRGNLRFTNQIIVPVLPLLNTSNTYLWFDFQSFWPLPNNNNLNTLYTSFGRLKEKGIEVDEEFVDQQRANQERRSFYQYIEGFFSHFQLNGTACMLRAICEMAEAPLSGNGLLGRAVEVLLTPSLVGIPSKMKPLFQLEGNQRDNSLFKNEDLAELDFITAPIEDEYTEAYRRGKDGRCWDHYATCPINIFKLVNI